jgi:hypothetical protein
MNSAALLTLLGLSVNLSSLLVVDFVDFAAARRLFTIEDVVEELGWEYRIACAVCLNEIQIGNLKEVRVAGQIRCQVA